MIATNLLISTVLAGAVNPHTLAQVEMAVDHDFGTFSCARFALDSKMLLLASKKGDIGYLDLATKKQTQRAGNGQPITDMFCVKHNNNELIFTFTDNGFALVYDGKDLALKTKKECHEVPIMAAAMTPDGKLAVTVGAEKKIRIWDTQTWQLSTELVGLKRLAWAICVTGDGKRIFSAHSDGEVCAWDVDKRKLIGVLGSHEKDAIGLILSKDERTLISVGFDDQIVVWDAKKCKRLASFREGKNDLISCVCFVGGEKYVAVGCGSGMLEIWDVEKKMCHKSFRVSRGVDQIPRSLALSPDGKCLLVRLSDGKAKMVTGFCDP